MLCCHPFRTMHRPCCFEAIFIGYKENHLGWHVQDLQGKHHFSCDVIFNELVPGHSSSRHKTTPTTIPTPVLPTSHPPSPPPPTSTPPHPPTPLPPN